MHRFTIIFLLFTVTLTLASPVYNKERERRERNNPMVVDIPAGMVLNDEVDDPIPLSISDEKDAEVIKPLIRTPDSMEDGVKSTDEDDSTAVKVPTIFLIRRPIISDRFPFFQQSPLFGSSSLFENRRPFFERPTFFQTPVSGNSDHAMISHMEQMMKQMQQQMSSLWSSFASPPFQRRPLRPLFPSLSFESDEDTGSNENGTIINIDNLPANYSNSTSETKVVDGHVVQVNKTVHKISSGNNTSGFFHFEIINVRPTEGGKPEAPIPEAVETKPAELPELTVQPTPELPKIEDPALNEVAEINSTPDQHSVSGVDSGLLADEPKSQTQLP